MAIARVNRLIGAGGSAEQDEARMAAEWWYWGMIA